MTKKSPARLLRDAEAKAKKDNATEALSKPIWDDVQEIYANAVHALQSNVTIGLVLNNQKLVSHIKDVAQLAKNVQILTKDLQMLKAELMEISAQHASLSGRPKNLDDYVFALQISEQYAAWTERYEGIVMPTVKFINEQVYEAEQLLLSADAAASESLKASVAPVLEFIKTGEIETVEKGLSPEQDPAVITDVVIKTE